MPERFAHGYQVLEDETETSYQVGEFYTPEHEGGLRYNDRGSALTWPLPVARCRTKDAAWAMLDEVEAELERRWDERPSGTTAMSRYPTALLEET